MNEVDLQRMAHTMRHRLRNIAAGLRGSLSFLEEEMVDSIQSGLAEYFPLMYRECDGLQTIANRLTLFFDRLPDGDPCSSKEISEKVVDLVAARFPSVNFRFQGTCCHKVDGLMETALTEILVNACEAAPSGIVETRFDVKGERVHWIVLNSGSGINSADTELDCFAPFTTTRPRHLGLGLPIARRLCEHAGGGCVPCLTENDDVFAGGVEISAVQR